MPRSRSRFSCSGGVVLVGRVVLDHRDDRVAGRRSGPGRRCGRACRRRRCRGPATAPSAPRGSRRTPARSRPGSSRGLRSWTSLSRHSSVVSSSPGAVHVDAAALEHDALPVGTCGCQRGKPSCSATRVGTRSSLCQFGVLGPGVEAPVEARPGSPSGARHEDRAGVARSTSGRSAIGGTVDAAPDRRRGLRAASRRRPRPWRHR